MTITISKNQARDFAMLIKGEIHSYIEENQAAYIEWLRRQSCPECIAELKIIEGKFYNA